MPKNDIVRPYGDLSKEDRARIRDEVVQDFIAGKTQAYTSERLGISPKTYWRILGTYLKFRRNSHLASRALRREKQITQTEMVTDRLVERIMDADNPVDDGDLAKLARAFADVLYKQSMLTGTQTPDQESSGDTIRISLSGLQVEHHPNLISDFVGGEDNTVVTVEPEELTDTYRFSREFLPETTKKEDTST